jgi:hypothetical protein
LDVKTKNRIAFTIELVTKGILAQDKVEEFLDAMDRNGHYKLPTATSPVPTYKRKKRTKCSKQGHLSRAAHNWCKAWISQRGSGGTYAVRSDLATLSSRYDLDDTIIKLVEWGRIVKEAGQYRVVSPEETMTDAYKKHGRDATALRKSTGYGWAHVSRWLKER